MVSSAQAKMIDSLPSELVKAAVDLSERAGASEYCFPVRDAQHVLESLLGAGLVVLGGDVWVRDGGEYFPAGEGWYVDSIDGESPVDRADRIRQTAGRFLDLHRDSDDEWVTFVVKS